MTQLEEEFDEKLGCRTFALTTGGRKVSLRAETDTSLNMVRLIFFSAAQLILNQPQWLGFLRPRCMPS